jgi:hypothetical protein
MLSILALSLAVASSFCRLIHASMSVRLMRPGYIGTHRIESDALHPIISEVAKGNRALVLACQKRVEGGGES